MMAQKAKPQRMCIGCRQFKDKKELIRVVRTPEGAIELDPSGKLAGRGAYLCCDEQCLKKALKSRSLEKAFKCQVSEQVLAALAARLAAEE